MQREGCCQIVRPETILACFRRRAATKYDSSKLRQEGHPRKGILAAGNSNGDIPMLRFCAHPSRPSLALLLDHDDAEREFSYQTGAEQALDRARQVGWTTVSMKGDWKTMFVEPS
jgi:hypothetical protein